MSKPLFIAEHSCHAHGLIGRLISKIMAWDTAVENRRAIDLLGVSDARQILDFGCGHGRWLGFLKKIAPSARIVGADASDTMLREAASRNRVQLKAGTVTLHKSTSATLPFQDNRFDRILSMHTLYFLHPLETYFCEWHRICAPGGRMVIGFRPGEDRAWHRKLPCEVYRMRTTDEARQMAENAGFLIEKTVKSALPSRSMVWLCLRKD